MSTHLPRSIPELAERLSQEIEKTYLECTIKQKKFILEKFNAENNTHLQNMNGDLFDWLCTMNPMDVLMHFRKLRFLILTSKKLPEAELDDSL